MVYKKQNEKNAILLDKKRSDYPNQTDVPHIQYKYGWILSKIDPYIP
jgi:hypothetical protein